MSVIRVVDVLLGGAGVLAFATVAARGKCRSWVDAFIAIMGTIALICAAVGACWLLLYGITGTWPWAS